MSQASIKSLADYMYKFSQDGTHLLKFTKEGFQAPWDLSKPQYFYTVYADKSPWVFWTVTPELRASIAADASKLAQVAKTIQTQVQNNIELAKQYRNLADGLEQFAQSLH